MYVATLFTAEGRVRLTGEDPDLLKSEQVIPYTQKVETWAWRIVHIPSATLYEQWVDENERSRFPGLEFNKEGKS